MNGYLCKIYCNDELDPKFYVCLAGDVLEVTTMIYDKYDNLGIVVENIDVKLMFDGDLIKISNNEYQYLLNDVAANNKES